MTESEIALSAEAVDPAPGASNATLGTWQTAVSDDANSLFADPLFPFFAFLCLLVIVPGCKSKLLVIWSLCK